MCKSSLHRECLQCGNTFVTNRKNKVYCNQQCASRSSAKKHYHANRDAHRCGKLQKKYGITLEQRDAMYAAQDAKCAVCDTHMTLESHKPNSAHVDHCHATGEVGALLCSECNTGIGKLGENPVILAKAIQYLTETGKVPTR